MPRPPRVTPPAVDVAAEWKQIRDRYSDEFVARCPRLNEAALPAVRWLLDKLASREFEAKKLLAELKKYRPEVAPVRRRGKSVLGAGDLVGSVKSS